MEGVLGFVIAERRLRGLKDKKEELENEKDPQNPLESSRSSSSSAQRSDWTLRRLSVGKFSHAVLGGHQ